MAKKNSLMPLLLLGGAGAAGYYLYSTGRLNNLLRFTSNRRSNIAELKLRLTGFHANTDGTVLADIEVLNPTSQPFQVQSILGEFFINGRRAGTVKMFGDQVLRPNDQSMIPVNVKVLPAAYSMFRKRGQTVLFRGQINLNNNIAPLTMNYVI